MFYFQEFLFTNNAWLAYQTRTLIMQDVQTRMADIRSKIEQLADPVKKRLVINLYDYLLKRNDEVHMLANNIATIQSRTIHVSRVAQALVTNNEEEINHLFAESNISRFKGYFTQRFYDLLKGFQSPEHTNEERPTWRQWFCRPW